MVVFKPPYYISFRSRPPPNCSPTFSPPGDKTLFFHLGVPQPPCPPFLVASTPPGTTPSYPLATPQCSLTKIPQTPPFRPLHVQYINPQSYFPLDLIQFSKSPLCWFRKFFFLQFYPTSQPRHQSFGQAP